MSDSKNLKLKCPSCSTEHDLNDYPGAFEIPCSCGYSILVPDVDAFLSEDPGEETKFESRVPTAMEAEDEELQIKPDQVAATGDLSFEVLPEIESDSLAGAVSMTPPESLPKEMAYDPFEIQEPDQKVSDVIAESSSFRLKDTEQDSIGSVNTIIQKNQFASFGQLVGPNYQVHFKGLSRDQKLELMHRVENLLRERPWLDEYCRKNQIRIEEIVEKDSLLSVPEIIAVEMFLVAIELGGDAEVVSSPSL